MLLRQMTGARTVLPYLSVDRARFNGAELRWPGDDAPLSRRGGENRGQAPRRRL